MKEREKSFSEHISFSPISLFLIISGALASAFTGKYNNSSPLDKNFKGDFNPFICLKSRRRGRRRRRKKRRRRRRRRRRKRRRRRRRRRRNRKRNRDTDREDEERDGEENET